MPASTISRGGCVRAGKLHSNCRPAQVGSDRSNSGTKTNPRHARSKWIHHCRFGKLIAGWGFDADSVTRKEPAGSIARIGIPFMRHPVQALVPRTWVLDQERTWILVLARPVGRKWRLLKGNAAVELAIILDEPHEL